MTVRDLWADWLLERRFTGQPRSDIENRLAHYRDKVLSNARLGEGETLLDIGCGDGLIGFAALGRGVRTVVFSDISQQLLDTCAATAAGRGVLARCRFLRMPADDLAAIPDCSIDVVTTRSVLIYVKEKQRAFAEFHRVLRPGGRVSLFEPVNRLSNFLTAYDTGPVASLADRVRAVFEQIQPPGRDPMLDFDDRDLINLAENAGFAEIRLRLEVEVKPPKPCPWEQFLQTVGNPKIPSYGEAMEQALQPAEREQLAAQLRPLVEQGHGRLRTALAYLVAVKR
jgi:arsenite methyltransferase